MEFIGEISTCSFTKGVITVVCIVFGVLAADITCGEGAGGEWGRGSIYLIVCSIDTFGEHICNDSPFIRQVCLC